MYRNNSKIPWRRKWQPTPVLLPGETHGGRSLVGYSPWRRKESDTLEKDLCQHARVPRTVLLIASDTIEGHCQPKLLWKLLDTHRQVCLSLSWHHCSVLLVPGARKVLFVPSKSLFPQSCGSSVNQIPLAFKIKFPGGSQSLCQIPRLENLSWVLKLL